MFSKKVKKYVCMILVEACMAAAETTHSMRRKGCISSEYPIFAT
jgi:hypothetical protein